MDGQSVAFLEVMVAIGVLGLVAFLIFLVSRQTVRPQGGAEAASYQPGWVEVLLAAAAVIVVAIVLLWQYPPWTGAGLATATSGNDRATAFFVVMAVIGVAGFIIFLLTALWRHSQQRRSVSATDGPLPVASQPLAPSSAGPSTMAASAQAAARYESPSTVRLLGILGFALAYLILNWSYVPYGQQFTMMLSLVYPAGLIIALVMMFDKASRAWQVKLPGESLREWIHSNIVLLLFLIGYLNLLGYGSAEGAPEGYRAMFWDFVHVMGLLLVLWVLDRKTTRFRFLFAHGWLIALPLLLLIWQSVQGAAAIDAIEGIKTATELSWWSTIWPFFFLALVFFVLELIILIGNRDNTSQGAGTAKDVIFLLLYVIILIAARPTAVAG